MSSHVGHAIQKIMQNVPVSVSVSDNCTTVVTNGSGALQAGLIGGRVQSAFRELPLSAAVGTVVDAQSTESCVYVLSSEGSVFAVFNGGSGCSTGGISEVFIPSECDGYAKKIAAGRDHCLIWTDKSKVFGVGSNDNYQLVPQGQCRYDYATEIQITDYLTHNNSATGSFCGTITEANTPVVNPGTVTCGKAVYVKQDAQQVYLGNLLQLTNVNYFATNANNAVAVPGTLLLPLYADVRYSGFIGVDSSGVASGTISYETSGIYTYTPSNTLTSTGTFIPNAGVTFEVSNSIEDRLYLTDGVSVGTASVAGVCGTPINVPLATTLRGTLTVSTQTNAVGGAIAGSEQQSVIILTLASTANPLNILGLTSVALINGNYTVGASVGTITGTPSFPLNLECCNDCCASVPSSIPKKCWKNIFAGFDISVLVDDCNGLFALGSIHELRDNSWFLKNNCLQSVLNQAFTTITFPASELNCDPSTACGGCAGSSGQKFSQDLLNRIGVQLSFDPNSGNNVCDFLQTVKNCNGVSNCTDACTSCDTSVYLDIDALGTNPVDTAALVTVANVILYNAKSLSKQVASLSASNLTLTPSYTTLAITSSSVVDFNANKYCIDGSDYSIDKALLLTTPNTNGSTVVLYVDTDVPGGLRFALPTGRTNNVRFVGNTSVAASSVMNYGSVLDPVVLTNLKTVLATIATPFAGRQYRNPPVTRVYSTYLQGGDCICFSANLGNERLIQSVTADLPTLFRLNRSILQVGVGNNFLSVLSGSLVCPSEVLGLGVNCNGQLGVGSRQNALTWQTVNRCYFTCPVVGLSCGESVTFFLTQGGCIWASGKWKCLVDSLVPTLLSAVPATWKVKKIAAGRRSMLLLSADGCVYGLGENSMGELGNGSTSCIAKPTLLSCIPLSYVSMSTATRRLAHESRLADKACCEACASGASCCPSQSLPEEPFVYTRRYPGTRTAKYIPNGRISLSQRCNK